MLHFRKVGSNNVFVDASHVNLKLCHHIAMLSTCVAFIIFSSIKIDVTFQIPLQDNSPHQLYNKNVKFCISNFPLSVAFFCCSITLTTAIIYSS